MADTGIELKQLTNCFVNNCKRYRKPRIEELRKNGGLTLQGGQTIDADAANESANANDLELHRRPAKP